jgi:hypothetical protein
VVPGGCVFGIKAEKLKSETLKWKKMLLRAFEFFSISAFQLFRFQFFSDYSLAVSRAVATRRKLR